MFMMQFQRPAFFGLTGLWSAMEYGLDGRRRWALAANDLVYAAAILPLICIDFRTPMSNVVTCSDASLEGAGVVYSRKLTAAGRRGLGRVLRAPADLGDKYWVLVESFTGIAGCRRAAMLVALRPPSPSLRSRATRRRRR